MTDYRPMLISSLVLNAIIVKYLTAYNGSDNFFKFITIILDIIVIAVAVFDLAHNPFNKKRRRI